jgi:hypothetical protein
MHAHAKRPQCCAADCAHSNRESAFQPRHFLVLSLIDTLKA